MPARIYIYSAQASALCQRGRPGGPGGVSPPSLKCNRAAAAKWPRAPSPADTRHRSRPNRSQREWHAERMPIAVRLAPIADPFVLPLPEFDHEYVRTTIIKPSKRIPRS